MKNEFKVLVIGCDKGENSSLRRQRVEDALRDNDILDGKDFTVEAPRDLLDVNYPKTFPTSRVYLPMAAMGHTKLINAMEYAYCVIVDGKMYTPQRNQQVGYVNEIALHIERLIFQHGAHDRTGVHICRARIDAPVPAICLPSKAEDEVVSKYVPFEPYLELDLDALSEDLDTVSDDNLMAVANLVEQKLKASHERLVRGWKHCMSYVIEAWPSPDERVDETMKILDKTATINWETSPVDYPGEWLAITYQVPGAQAVIRFALVSDSINNDQNSKRYPVIIVSERTIPYACNVLSRWSQAAYPVTPAFMNAIAESNRNEIIRSMGEHFIRHPGFLTMAN